MNKHIDLLTNLVGKAHNVGRSLVALIRDVPEGLVESAARGVDPDTAVEEDARPTGISPIAQERDGRCGAQSRRNSYLPPVSGAFCPAPRTPYAPGRIWAGPCWSAIFFLFLSFFSFLFFFSFFFFLFLFSFSVFLFCSEFVFLFKFENCSHFEFYFKF
jgi:hypothetical protein